MNASRRHSRLAAGAFTLVELLIASAISSAMCASLLVGTVLIQKSFAASRHHVDAQAEQMRLTDYMALDLRRALTVSVTPTSAGSQLAITIPDYYTSGGTPRDPQISNGTAVYGPTPVAVSYYKRGDTIYRKQGTVETALCTDVNDFQLTFQDLGQSISTSVTFLPRFQFTRANEASVRNGTATYTTTLLRNKRHN